MGTFTDYELHVDEVIKGSIMTDVIHIEAVGGCDGEMCLTTSIGYQYEIGDQVFILLKKRTDWPFYQSIRQVYTAYYLSGDGRIYKHPEELEVISGAVFERTHPPEPTTLDEIRAILEKQITQ